METENALLVATVMGECVLLAFSEGEDSLGVGAGMMHRAVSGMISPTQSFYVQDTSISLNERIP